MNNFLQRTLTGIIYVAFLVLGTLSDTAFPIVFPALMVLVLVEYYTMALGPNSIQKWLPSVLISLVLFGMSYFYTERSAIAVPILVIMGVISAIYVVFQLFTKQRIFKSDIFRVLFGITYVSFPFVLLPFLSSAGVARWEWLLTLLIIIWLYDSFAYIFGVSFGKHRLYEKISPKKSWEGALGGLFTSMLVVFVAHHFFAWMNSYSMTEILVLTFVIIIAATLGDLVESMLKRTSGVKDSGNLLPGHGGFFDRLDSFILAVPMVMLLLLIYKVW